MAAKDAVVNNEAVLAHYMEKLSSQDVHTYVTISDKLTLWLRSDRAYYAAVRPKILDLLEAAHKTLREALGVNTGQSIQDVDLPPHKKIYLTAYRILMQTVFPFYSFFVEVGAQDRLKVLFSVAGIIPQALRPPDQPTMPKTVVHHHPTSAGSHGLQSSAMKKIDPNDTNTAWPATFPQPQAGFHQTVVPSNQVPPVGTQHVFQSQGPTATHVLTSQPTHPASSTSTSILTKHKAKRRKTGADSYILADLEWYKSKDVNKVTIEPISSTASSNLQSTPDPVSRTVTGIISPSSMHSEQHIQASSSPDHAGRPKQEQLSPPSYRPTSAASSDTLFSQPQKSEASVVELDQPGSESLSGSRDPPPLSMPNMEGSVGEGEPTSLLPSSSTQPLDAPLSASAISPPSFHPAPAEQDMVLASPSTDLPDGTLLPTSSTQPMTVADPHTALPSLQPLNPGTPLNESLVVLPLQPHALVDASTSHSILPRGNAGTDVNAQGGEYGNAIVSDNQPINVENSAGAGEAPMHATSPIKQSIFLVQDTMVIALQRGFPHVEVTTITFNINERQFSLLSQWNDRRKTTNDVSDSLCLSLACYPCASLQATLASGSNEPTLQDVSSSPCSWPNTGGLSLNIKWKEGREQIPLSPPLYFVTPDEHVDVTPFVVLGENVVYIEQRRDMSQYVFALRTHRPTAMQLKELAGRRQSENAFKAWHKTFSRPIEITPPWQRLRSKSINT